MRRILTGLVLVLMLTGEAAAGPLADGVAAYERGDYSTALRLWQPLAEQGYASTQYSLGVRYAYGQGVPQDNVQAHMWFNLAATKGDDAAIGARKRIAANMTHEQIADAQKLARQWKPK